MKHPYTEIMEVTEDQKTTKEFEDLVKGLQNTEHNLLIEALVVIAMLRERQRKQ